MRTFVKESKQIVRIENAADLEECLWITQMEGKEKENFAAVVLCRSLRAEEGFSERSSGE